MSQATDYFEGKTLDALSTLGTLNFATGAVTAGSGGYIGLMTSPPSDTGAGTEVTTSSSAYARVQVGSTGQGSFSGSAGSTTNDTEFKWEDATANWGTITHVGLFDAATGGNLLVYGALQSSVAIETGDIFKIPASGFTIQMN
jgi:hypothetical protein